MIFAERKKEDLKFAIFLIISTMINMTLFLIPSCNKQLKHEELPYESIKTGLISIADTDIKEYKKEATGVEALVNQISADKMKTEEKGKVTATADKNIKPGIGNSSEKQGTGKAANEGVKSFPQFTGPTREDNGISGVALTNSTSKNLREKQEGIYQAFGKPSGSESLKVKNSGLKGVELGSNSLKDGTKAVQTGNYEKNTIGMDKDNSGIKSKDSEKVVINDNGVNSSVPKNISANVLDVAGGRVIWKKYLKPDYPEEAEKNAWTGNVEVEFLVKSGKTTFLGVTGKSGYSVFDREVEKAAKNWLLLIEKNGIAVNGKVRVKVKFDF